MSVFGVGPRVDRYNVAPKRSVRVAALRKLPAGPIVNPPGKKRPKRENSAPRGIAGTPPTVAGIAGLNRKPVLTGHRAEPAEAARHHAGHQSLALLPKPNRHAEVRHYGDKSRLSAHRSRRVAPPPWPAAKCSLRWRYRPAWHRCQLTPDRFPAAAEA